MKRFFLQVICSCLLLFSSTSFSQITEVTSNLDGNAPLDLVYHNNNLFMVGTPYGYQRDHRVFQIDLSKSPLTFQLPYYRPLYAQVYDLKFYGDSLFVAETSIGKIRKVEVYSHHRTQTEILKDIRLPWSLAFHGDDLYFTSAEQTKLYKTNIKKNSIHY
jgi:hypothetical protein